MLKSIYIHNEPLHVSANYVAETCRGSLCRVLICFNKLTLILLYHNIMHPFLCLYTPQSFKFLICKFHCTKHIKYQISLYSCK